jgi:hypothetical protein
MQQDILRIISLYIPIHHLLSFILATYRLKIVNPYFWTLRLLQDYNRVGGLELYKKYYQYKSVARIVRVNGFTLNMEKVLNLERGDILILTSKNIYIYDTGSGYVDKFNPLLQPLGINPILLLYPKFRFIEEFSIHYFDALPQFANLNKTIYFDASPYEDQIEANKTEYRNGHVDSSFKSWNGDEYVIGYPCIDIYQLCVWELTINAESRSLLYMRQYREGIDWRVN